MLPDVDYKAAAIRKRIRKNVPNYGDAPDVYFNARDKFRITIFYAIVDQLEIEMKKRGEIYIEKLQRYFLFLVMYHCHKMPIHLLTRKGILSVLKSFLMISPKILAVISQLTFSSLIHTCSIISVKQKI